MVNLRELDKLVDDHLRFDAACSRAYHDRHVPNPSSDADVFAALHSIRKLIMCGQVDEAVALADRLCGQPVDDASTQLNIRLHKLVELIYNAEILRRRASDSPPDSYSKYTNQSSPYHVEIAKALRYSRELAAYALDAFPEAYALFTDHMMFFVRPEQVTSTQFIQDHRKTLADQVIAVVRLSIGARDSSFSCLMRYLILVYLQFRAPVMSLRGDEVSELHSVLRRLVMFELKEGVKTERIMWRTDTPTVTRHGVSQSFCEADIQALPERVGISRQHAIDALKFTNGDVEAALRNELARVVVSPTRLRELAVAYCAARGLPAVEVLAATDAMDEDSCEAQKANGTRNGSGNGIQSALKKTAAVMETDNGGEAGDDDDDDAWMMDANPDAAFAALATDRQRVMVREEDLSHDTRAIWRGMRDVRAARALDGELERLQALREAAERVGVRVDAGLRFRLAQREAFLAFRRGGMARALELVRMELGTIVATVAKANNNSDGSGGNDDGGIKDNLVSQLEDTLLLLACARADDDDSDNDDDDATVSAFAGGGGGIAEQSIKANRTDDVGKGKRAADARRQFKEAVDGASSRVRKHCTERAIDACFYAALERAHGEPPLLPVLHALLEAHEDWQRHCQLPDRFSGALRIDALTSPANTTADEYNDDNDDGVGDGDTAMDVVPTKSRHSQQSTQQEQQLQQQEQQQQMTGEARDVASSDARTEHIVLTLMEFLAISRAEALSIIRNHPHASNAEAILDSLLGSA